MVRNGDVQTDKLVVRRPWLSLKMNQRWAPTLSRSRQQKCSGGVVRTILDAILNQHAANSWVECGKKAPTPTL